VLEHQARHLCPLLHALLQLLRHRHCQRPLAMRVPPLPLVTSSIHVILQSFNVFSFCSRQGRPRLGQAVAK
jgi:hypothetical protein